MRKILLVALTWFLVAVVVLILYLCRENTPVKEFIAWLITVWPLIVVLGACALGISGWILKHNFSKKNQVNLEEGIQPIVKAKDDYANIQVEPRIHHNRAVLEIISTGIDADFTAKARVIKGVPPQTIYTMCWDSTPYLEHPIKKGDTSTIIVAESTSSTTGIVYGGLALYQVGLTGQIEKVRATTQELIDTVVYNMRYPTMAKPVDDNCTIEVTITGTPPLLNAFENQKYKIEIDHEQGHKLLIAPLPELETQLKLDVGKLLLDGKEILVDLGKMNAQLDSMGAVSAELKFEIWYKDVSKTLQNTDYDRLWFENKEGLDYRTAKKSDYLEACKHGLDRLEYIKKLMFDKEGAQTELV